jgi:anti-sigma B factor antagonist
MDITNKQINGATVLQLAGRFDAYAAPDVEIFFQKINTDPMPHVIVNLSQVNFIDSTGLATLVIGMKRCRRRQGDLVLCGVQQAVRVIFELTSLNKILTMTGTQEEAIATVHMQQKG